MPFDIVERTVGGETNKRCIVDNLHPPLVRTMAIGTDWTKLRIGIRLAVTRNSAWNPAPRVYFGLCAGKDDPPGSATPKHFLGMTPGNDWTWNGAMNVFSIPNMGVIIQNGVEGTAGNWGNRDALPHVDTGLGAWFVDFTKNSPTAILVQRYLSHTGNSITLPVFKNAMENINVAPSGNIDNGGGFTFTVDEALYGHFNTICFVFLGVSDHIEVSDMAYARSA